MFGILRDLLLLAAAVALAAMLLRWLTEDGPAGGPGEIDVDEEDYGE